MTVDVRQDHDEGVGAVISRVVADGRAYAEAEIGYWRALIADRMTDARGAAIFGFSALLLVNAAVIALIVGLLMTLATLVGPGFATLIVVAGTLVLAGLLGWLAWKRVSHLMRPRRQS